MQKTPKITRKTTLFSLMEKDVFEIPLHIGLENLGDLTNHSTWLIPKALAAINTLELVRNEAGLFSPTKTLATLKHSLAGDTTKEMWWTNLFKHLRGTPRGGMVLGSGIKQLSNPNVSSLVPLALSAFKLYRGVNYSSWDWTDPRMSIFVDNDLMSAVKYSKTLISNNLDDSDLAEFDLDELKALRAVAVRVKSTGVIKPPTSVTTVYNLGNPDFDQLPKLTKIMLLQLWVADPSVRTKLMILDPTNLDNMPEPLEPTTIIDEPTNTEEIKPW